MTAEEFFRNKIKELYPFKEVITLSQELITGEQRLRWAHEFMKFHVKAALKTASEKVEHDIDIDWLDPYDYSAGHNGIKGYIDKNSILNAYPLENIK